MPPRFHCTVATCRFPSEGIAARIYNALEAIPRKGDVNHVTGDVQYLTYFIRGRRTLLTVLDCGSLHRLRGLRRALFRLLWYDVPLRRAAMVSAISEFTRREIGELLGSDPASVRVVPCCVSPAFRPAVAKGLRKRPLILQVGTSANKNVIRLAEAVAGMDCDLRIIGQLSEGQRRALAASRASFDSASGLSVQQMAEAYEGADLVTLASTYEGFGLPIVEANAVGRPVVTSDRCSMPEVANGAACLVDPFDAVSIRSGIGRVLGDDGYRAELVEAGFANARRFEPSLIATMYADLYDELAGMRGAH